MGVSAPSGGVMAGWSDFGDLYRGEAPRLVVFAMALGAAPDRAADLAQESLVALWRRWEDVPGKPRTFARILALRADREPADTADTAEPEKDGEDTDAADAPDEPSVDAASDAVSDAASNAAATGPLRFTSPARHDAFLTGLAELAPQERQVLSTTFDDLAPEDVAQVLQIRVDAVAPTLDTARTRLEGLLDGQPAQPAYEALVADLAAGMDLEAGLALVAESGPRPGRPTTPAPRAQAQIPDELVAAAMTGDRTAVAQLLEMLRPLVARYCRGKLGPVNRSFVSADDVAQEVCLAVLGALPNYRMQGRPFLAFVYGIASHKVIDAHRAVTRAKADPVAEVPDTVAGEAGPEQEALRGALSAQLRELLDELPDKQREILLLRIVVGLSAEETAQMVGASPGAVRVAQHRALARLRKNAPRSLVQDQP